MSSPSEVPPAPQRDSSGGDHAFAEVPADAPPAAAPPVEADLEPLPSPTRRAPQVETGRLYRSAGAEGATAAAALPALDVEVDSPGSDAADVPTPTGSAAPPVSPTPSVSPTPDVTPRMPFGAQPVGPSQVDAEAPTPMPVKATPVSPAPAPPMAAGRSAQGDAVTGKDQQPAGTTYGSPSPGARGAAKGLTFLGVAVVIFGVTEILAIADILGDRKLGVITGIGFVAACIYAALLVRTQDAIALLIVPPLAWLLMLLTVGQFTIKGTGSFAVREGLMVLQGLAVNAPAILIGTLVGLVIALTRRAIAARR